MYRTPLYPIYEKYSARIVDFHDWALPVQFSGIIQEHQTVRNRVGLFDVSHMGEIMVQGPESIAFLDYALTNQISGLEKGGIRYSPFCFKTGGTVDDLLVYCLGMTKFLLVVNASNTKKDFEFLQELAAKFRVTITDLSEETAQLALQGPAAAKVLSRLTNFYLPQLKYYHFIEELTLANYPVLLSRTGYTGEDGFEIYLRPDQAVAVWEILMETGAMDGIAPIGLGARDTLRFEAGLPLYGNELSETISPLEAGLKRFVNLGKPDFVGKEQLQKEFEQGPKRCLIGLEITDRGIPRSGYPVTKNDVQVGYVTSGSYCPTLGKNLAMVLMKAEYAGLNQELAVDIRGKTVSAKTVKLPFYTRPKGVLKQ